jgi:hypothetical protein
MNSRRSSSDELEATALLADHDVEEPIERYTPPSTSPSSTVISTIERSKRVSSGEPPIAMTISVEIQNFGTEGGIKAK